MVNPVGWFDIFVNNIDRAQHFYEFVFNVELKDIIDPSDSYIKMKAFPCNTDKYGATGALVSREETTAGESNTIIYFSCEDCKDEESRVDSGGGCIVKSKYSIGQYGYVSLVRDSEGNTIGLHSHI